MTNQNAPILLLVVFCFASCATDARVYRGIDKSVQEEDFKKGVELIDKAQSGRKPIYPQKNIILLYLDRGLLTHYAGMYDESSSDMGQAERLIEEAYTKSISAGIASYILNDNMKDYDGEDYENIYLNVFNALNYYHQGSIDDALVETRRVNEKLRVLATKYDKINQEMRENYGSDLSEVDLPESKPANFSNSALADYLGALFYRADDAHDDARINLLQLRDAFATSPNVYYNPIPPALVLSGEEGDETAEELTLPQDKARVNLVCFTGLSPIKQEEVVSIPLPFPYGLDFAHLRLPALSPRSDEVTSIKVEVDGGTEFELELLEDIGMVVRETYNAKYNSVLLKTLIRTIVKYLGVYVAAEAAAQASDNEGLGALTALTAKVAFDASERADIRMERYLPAKAWIGAVNLEPGEYNITISYYANETKIYTEEKTLQAAVERLNLMEGVCLK